MKLTNIDAYGGFNVVNHICMTVDMSVKAGFVMSRNRKRLEKAAREYDEDRAEIWKKHGAEVENGVVKTDKNNQVIFENEEAKAKAIEEMTLLNEEEINLNLRMLSIGDFGDRAEMKPAMLEAIDFMIEEYSDEPQVSPNGTSEESLDLVEAI